MSKSEIGIAADAVSLLGLFCMAVAGIGVIAAGLALVDGGIARTHTPAMIVAGVGGGLCVSAGVVLVCLTGGIRRGGKLSLDVALSLSLLVAVVAGVCIPGVVIVQAGFGCAVLLPALWLVVAGAAVMRCLEVSPIIRRANLFRGPRGFTVQIFPPPQPAEDFAPPSAKADPPNAR